MDLYSQKNFFLFLVFIIIKFKFCSWSFYNNVKNKDKFTEKCPPLLPLNQITIILYNAPVLCQEPKMVGNLFEL